jgi:toxin ParE1/3/4
MARDPPPHPCREVLVRWHVHTRVAADADIQEAHQWYESQRAGLGDEFLLALAETFSHLEEGPERFPRYFNQYRRALTDVFPFKVFFHIEGDAVIVARVLHAAREHTWRLR